MITTEQDHRLLEWAAKVLGSTFDPRQCAWISKVGDDGPVAVVVYTRFSSHNCEMSIATNGQAHWGSREFMRVCYDYAFRKAGLRRITVVVEDDNHKSLAMCRKLGHVEEGRLKHWFGNRDGIVMRMLREECRWIRG